MHVGDSTSDRTNTPDTTPGSATEPEQAPEPTPPPTRSPAEAFAELSGLIEATRRDVAQVADYVRGSATRIQRTADEIRLEGADAALRAVIRLHELLYKHARDADASEDKHRGLLDLLRDAAEGELRSLAVSIVEPELGEAPDLHAVVTIANRPVPRLRPGRVGTVAEVVSPGYVLRTESIVRVLKKAEVVIWRARKEPAVEQATKDPQDIDQDEDAPAPARTEPDEMEQSHGEAASSRD